MTVYNTFLFAGVRTTHKLTYEACETLRSIFSKSDALNAWTASPKVLSEWCGHFYSKLEEVTMHIDREHVRVKSFVEELVDTQPGGHPGK